MDALDRYLEGKSPQFSPEPWYNRDGDCLHVLFRDSDYYAKRIDDVLTVLVGHEDGEIVGCLVKGITHIAKQLGHMGISIQNTPLNVLIMGTFFADENRQEKASHLVYYQKLVDQVAPRSVPA